MKVVKNQPKSDEAERQRTHDNVYSVLTFHALPSVEKQFASVVVVCHTFSQPEHVGSAEDDIKLGAVHLRSSLCHLGSLAQTRLLQQKLSWRRKGRTQDACLFPGCRTFCEVFSLAML